MGRWLILCLLLPSVAWAASRTSELCPDGTYHQQGFCPAELTNATVSDIGQTVATVDYTTDEADGDTYLCIVSDGTEYVTPQAVQSCNAGDSYVLNLPEDEENVFDVTGLGSGLDYVAQMVNLSPEGWYSNILNSATFTTASAANVLPAYQGCDQSWGYSEAVSLDLDTCWSDSDALTHSTIANLPTGLSQGGTSNKDITGTTGTSPESPTVTLKATDGKTEVIATTVTTELSFGNIPFNDKSGSFVWRFTVTPVASSVDIVIALTQGSCNSYSCTAAAFRLNSSGQFDAKNGGPGYSADTVINYSAGVSYDVVANVDVDAETVTFSVDGQALATDYDFRDGLTITALDNFVSVDNATAGSTIENVEIPNSVIQGTADWVVFEADETPPGAPDAPTVDSKGATFVTLGLPQNFESDFASYEVWRLDGTCGTPGTQIATGVTGLTYQDTPLSADTDYCYALIEVDSSGNESTLGATLDVKTDEASALVSSVTFERDQAYPLGRCSNDTSISCSVATDCPDSSGDEARRNYCVVGVCSNDTDSFCTNDGQCSGGGACTEDITINFSEPLECGDFITNGKYCIAPADGEVTITSIIPAMTAECPLDQDGCENGWGIDLEAQRNPFTARAGNPAPRLDASPTLPQTIQVGSDFVSVIKAISGNPDCQGGSAGSFDYCASLLTAEVLTFVPNGTVVPANAFRPAFSGPTKQSTLYTTDDIVLSRMPNLLLSDLGNQSSIPSWSATQAYLGGVHLGIDGRNNVVGRGVGTVSQYEGGGGGYHRERSGRSAKFFLRLALDNGDFAGSTEQNALYAAIQQGIDRAGAMESWADLIDAGERGATKRIKDGLIPMIFAARLLDDVSLANSGADFLSEQDTFQDSPNYGSTSAADYLWGDAGPDCGPPLSSVNSKWCYDYEGYVEGFSRNGQSMTYQVCCSMGPWKGNALLVHLMQAEDVASPSIAGFLHVLGRFWDGWATDPTYNGGIWNSPNPNGTSLIYDHGDLGAITVSGQQNFSNDMWDSFRDCAAPVQGDGAASTTYPCTGQ